MQVVNSKNSRQNARDLTRLGAQWLNLLRFTAYPGAPTFSPNLCHYHAMLDPAATDADRLASCRAMRKCVIRRMQVEELEGKSRRTQNRPVDPYGLQWRTTPDGAALWMIAHLLSHAITAFEADLYTSKLPKTEILGGL